MVPPSSVLPRTPSASSLPDDPYVADLLHVADDNIASLRTQLDSSAGEKDALEGKVKAMRKQVRGRLYDLFNYRTQLCSLYCKKARYDSNNFQFVCVMIVFLLT